MYRCLALNAHEQEAASRAAPCTLRPALRLLYSDRHHSERAMQSIETLINDAFERRNELGSTEIETHLRPAIGQVLDLLESGERRVAEPDGQGGWTVNQWLKKAVLLYFRINDNRVVDGGSALAFDKVPLRFSHGNDHELQQLGARVVPGALVRRGAHIAKDAVLMPSYVTIGAYVGAGTMVDTWATVGSCAQIGAGVHLSGGVGSAECGAAAANPPIIEDNCHRRALGSGGRRGGGARQRDRHGCVLDDPPHLQRATGEVSWRVPAGSVVVLASAGQGRQSQPVRRDHRQAGRCEDTQQDQHQRTAAGGE